MPPSSTHLGQQTIWLLILSIPIASIAWTITHEEVFREPRNFCEQKSKACRSLLQRKFFYLFTCEYCFSHYITALAIAFTGFKLLLDDWRGYIIAFFATVWIANAYMSLFARLRVEIRSTKAQADAKAAEAIKRQHELEKAQGKDGQ